MPSMEEIMGLYGTLGAPGADEELQRRRRGPAAGGYEGIGGAQVTHGMLLPYLTGRPVYDYSGPMGRDFAGPGRGGLASLMAQAGEQGMQGNRFQGPAARHFANQGFDFMPPGQDNREAPGGPNIAPGNIDTGQALFQPQGPGHVPGIPQGVARGQAPGQVTPVPHTQGWRNVAPGYSAAAQYGYGTDQFEENLGIRPPGSRGAGPPAATGKAEGEPTIGRDQGRPLAGGGGPAAGKGGGPSSQNPIGGGGAPVAPAGPSGGGGQGTGGGGGGGKNVGPQQQGPRPRQVNAVRPGGEQRGPQGTTSTQTRPSRPKRPGGKQTRGAPKVTTSSAVGSTLNQVGQSVADVFSGNAQANKPPKPPNQGDNNTPSETTVGKTKPKNRNKGTSLIGGVQK